MRNRVVVTGVSIFVLALGLEFWAYPWSIEYGNFTFSFGITICSYLLVAFLVGAVAFASAYFTSLFRATPAIGQGITTGVLTLTALALFALLLGPFDLDIPGTRARGIFFAEWNFLNFSFEISLPCAVLAGFIVWIMRHYEQRRTWTATL